MATRRQMLGLLASLPLLKLAGCDAQQGQAANSCSPLLMTDEHDCHLCGMTAVNHPGPKGQACLRDGGQRVFCSVHDMLSWAWQPESAPAISALYVHDLSRTGWESPAHEAWMPADKAVYVVGHNRRAAMGHSPASFSGVADAEAFAEAYGGRLLALSELDWDNFRGHMNPHDH